MKQAAAYVFTALMFLPLLHLGCTQNKDLDTKYNELLSSYKLIEYNNKEILDKLSILESKISRVENETVSLDSKISGHNNNLLAIQQEMERFNRFFNKKDHPYGIKTWSTDDVEVFIEKRSP